ncbi:hypothetical protein BST27_12910 [Mycobacterium intermedium]|uniref:Uncharacterized protein n=1 Tax=Mycobacterium intermedium TaxID=28445 RepID=A0A1E3SAB3_MYCIE|nr:hypothetical protein [Mycobacterium intermedium]MCV6967725.1 hypothetical protein [Mycobacterium intermedium]ODQ99115.1 hypothetical protein BHQ20_18670 [Mycobacterium intermedium]OPE46160.1 hypothetical protein BV508_27000 [Mycobacterium intermedium]ORB05526.1 hypothetical protein BST27_12910 [Mycobacterium intermedium]
MWGALFAVFLIAVIVIKFFWWIIGAAAMIGLFHIARLIARWYSERSAAYARYWAGLAARADQQHKWVLRGDDRGIYGSEGAELMHRLFPAQNQIRRRTG